MRLKRKVKTRDSVLVAYGKPHDEAGLRTVSKPVSNHHTYNSILYATGKKAAFHDCAHISYQRMEYGSPIRQEILVSNPYKIVACNDHVLAAVYNYPRNPVEGDKRYPVDGGMDHVINNALVPAEMLKELSLRGAALKIPTFRNKVSLINFLIELKDLKRMITNMLELRAKLEKTFRFKDPMKVGNPVDPNQKGFSIRDIHNHHLEVEFGWLPFVSDVCRIAKALGTYRARLKQIIKDQHKIHVRKFSKSLPNMFLSDHIDAGGGVYVGPRLRDDLPDMTAFTSGGSSRTAIRTRRVVFTVKYSYWLPEMTKFQVELRSLAAALGVEWNPKILWDAIPFSFLVDWCVNVGDLLENRFAKPMIDVQLRVHEICVSETHRFSHEKTFTVPFVWSPPIPSSGQTYRYTSKGLIFRRYVNKFITEEEVKKMPWRGDPGAPSQRQLACFLSLIATNAKQVKKKKVPVPRKVRETRHGSWIRNKGR